MNHRSRSILLLAMENSILFNTLPEMYQVSSRTIRNDVQHVNAFLQEHGLGSMYIDKKMVKVHITDADKVLEIVNALTPYEYKFTHEERRIMCLLILLEAKGYVTMQALSDRLFISRSTIINDLKLVKDIAKEHGIRLIAKSNKGYKVQVEEEEARIFLHKLLHLDHVKVVEDAVFQMDMETEQRYRELANTLREYQGQLQMSERELIECLAYLTISDYRNKKGFLIEKDVFCNNEKVSDFLEHIFIEEKRHPYLCKEDIRFAVNAVSIKPPKAYVEVNVNHDYIRLQVASMQFIEKISQELNLDFGEDYIFYENFSNHIMRMLKKIDHVGKEEVILEEIVERNKRIKEAITLYLPILEKAIGREASQVEVKYIIIHVYAALERKKKKGSQLKVALLTDYRVSQRLLMESRLHNNFSFMLDTYSMEDVLASDQYDLILTTASIENSKYLRISVSISDEDYIKIAKSIDVIAKKKERQDFSVDRELAFKFYDLVVNEIDQFDFKDAKLLKENIRKSILKHTAVKSFASSTESLSEFLKEENIRVDVEAADWKEAVVAAGNILLEQGDIQQEYIDAVILNAETNGFYFVIADGFALPHASIASYNLRTAMSLVRLKNPIYFFEDKRDVPGDYKTHPVYYFCLLSATDNEKHSKAFFNLTSLLANSEFREALHRAKTSQQMAEVIKDFEYLGTTNT